MQKLGNGKWIIWEWAFGDRTTLRGRYIYGNMSGTADKEIVFCYYSSHIANAV